MSLAPSLSFSETYLNQAAKICTSLDASVIEAMAEGISSVRERGGRLFILGVGGSAGNAGHAVNDFRKLCNVEAYAPTDNVSELTARTNDEGWETVFANWLAVSRVSDKDGILVFSVGGGNAEANVSANLVHALKFAKERRVSIYGIVGRDGGYTAQVADAVVIVPTVEAGLVTPYAEAFQAVVWHCLVSHPALKKHATKW
ncbi:SIS domain-containing protein [Rhodospirillaceae bacterium KN72]|uniref:SIS domain-containing protein n=2 Tax=Pacificispira spongiicola TaxID=2729598 RepID=A0A7Y0HHH3_9PROT|nr:SIS domain-containing protein [Pacificispira spongiicola]